jgi:hypothetical protein
LNWLRQYVKKRKTNKKEKEKKKILSEFQRNVIQGSRSKLTSVENYLFMH